MAADEKRHYLVMIQGTSLIMPNEYSENNCQFSIILAFFYNGAIYKYLFKTVYCPYIELSISIHLFSNCLSYDKKNFRRTIRTYAEI